MYFFSSPHSKRISLAFLNIFSGFSIVVSAAALTEVTEFGPNPTGLKMFLYVPDNIVANPRVLVGVHWCHGTAQDFYNANTYKYYADQNKYIIIYPNANSDDSCFDVHSQETLTHDGGGDALGIASMVRYVIDTYHADPAGIYAAGHSSGGMMCNVLAGSYPDLFSAVSASAGVPFGCFSGGTSSWNDSCAKGLVVKTGDEWANIVHAAFPGYTGPRPRMQLWHGEKDDVLNFVNFESEVLQWTTVLGVGPDPDTTEANTPRATYTRMRFLDENGTVMVEAIKGADQTHNITTLDKEILSFLELDQPPAGTQPPVTRQSNRCFGLSMSRSQQGIRVSVSTRPGRIGAVLYALDGTKIVSIPDRYRPDGRLETVLMGGDAIAVRSIGIIDIIVDGVSTTQRCCLTGGVR